MKAYDSQTKENLSKSSSPYSFKAPVSSCAFNASGSRPIDSRNSNVGRHSVNTNKSWEASTGSEEIGSSFSYSLSVANHLSNDEKRSNTTNNLNRDDTSPLGGPSTFEDISQSRNNCYSDEKTSIKDRIQKLNSQFNSTEFQRINDSIKSSGLISQSTTSGSFCLHDGSYTDKGEKGIYSLKNFSDSNIIIFVQLKYTSRKTIY